MVARWYREGVIYSLDVRTFQDSNDDGIGDFPGLISRMDYLSRLGVTALWLNPIHPSPGDDGGYDVTDHYDVDPRLGSLGDFAEFMAAADERGLRVMLGLVVNHSVQFTMPGTPVLRYGDEIGMGEDLALPERNAIRTPMQWDGTAKHRCGRRAR